MSLATIKKGDKVILHMFTGVDVAVKEVTAATKTTISTESWHGEIKFSRKTGKQISPEPKNPRFANFITEDDGSFVSLAERRAAKKKAEKKAAKKAETSDDEVSEPVKPSRKVAKKSAAKKAAKKPDPVPEDEEYEEANDEEYEEA